ncbi:MAG: hypothetical protein KJO41_02720 [Bacteroidia bacterium]|nr:hypothetical protein [Bacteroidia bacterium]MBT8277888.1 hypothetical protein [Bacteroidia bacterium]NND25157.1 hypothetical protein [Flavobacteriaceae bacterium]NNK61530.1 hypothetical protein [Flavobacteriaceae bacterium]NNL33936.1 hypothetical protein [Flavobacteriaceae bacterium]
MDFWIDVEKMGLISLDPIDAAPANRKSTSPCEVYHYLIETEKHILQFPSNKKPTLTHGFSD